MPRRAAKKPREPVVLPVDDDAYIRLGTVLAVYPVGENTWHEGVRAGRYPHPVKLSERIVGWRVGDIRALLESRAGGSRTA
jgi:predicted DNA-binding transcriptional regulator AlpA